MVNVEAVQRRALQMCVQGQNKAAVSTYLQKEAHLDGIDADRIASKYSMEVSAARAQFSESKSKAKRSAYLKVGAGVFLLVMGLVLMAGGAESSGRRSPVGVVLASVFMIGAGVKDLMHLDSQQFGLR